MEACVVLCRANKPTERRGNVLFINAIDQVARERAHSFLRDEHIRKIVDAYQQFEDVSEFARVVPVDDIKANDSNLSIPLYVRRRSNGSSNGADGDTPLSLEETIEAWEHSSQELRLSMDNLFKTLREAGIDHRSK
jgi:type I restriction enzyme M protein